PAHWSRIVSVSQLQVRGKRYWPRWVSLHRRRAGSTDNQIPTVDQRPAHGGYGPGGGAGGPGGDRATRYLLVLVPLARRRCTDSTADGIDGEPRLERSDMQHLCDLKLVHTVSRHGSDALLRGGQRCCGLGGN